MTAYVVEWSAVQNGVAAFTSVSIAPSTLPLKINRVEYAGGGGAVNIFRSASGTVSGGTTLTPTLMRSGAPAASAACKFNFSSVSGTISYFVVSSTSPSPYQPPFSLMVAPGAVFGLAGQANTMTWVAIYFEEQRLQGGF